MGDTIVTAAMQKQYAEGVMILAQQTYSRFRDKCLFDGDIRGERKLYDQMGIAARPSKIVGRHTPTPPPVNDPHARRSVNTSPYDLVSMLDDDDKLRTFNDMQSPIMIANGMSFAREIDYVWLAAFFGTSYTGVDGTTPITFPSTQLVAVNYVESGSNVNSGLTIAKLRKANYLFTVNEVPEDEPKWIAAGAAQKQDLLRTTEVTNHDYNTVRALVDGKIDTFMGFTFVDSQILPVASSVRTLPCWSNMGMRMAMRKEPFTRVDQRTDLRYTTQLYTKMDIGATRMEEKRCVEIDCLES